MLTNKDSMKFEMFSSCAVKGGKVQSFWEKVVCNKVSIIVYSFLLRGFK